MTEDINWYVFLIIDSAFQRRREDHPINATYHESKKRPMNK